MAEDRMLSDEVLLALIKKNSGGGGGGTDDYNDLKNQPKINNNTLVGNKTASDLGLADNTTVQGILDGQEIDSFGDVETALAGKQDATDNNLDTDAKTIVGAINEHEGDISSLKSGFTNLDNEVNGDATVYPYADAITIEDAVPTNLADCSVKIEPVQDLHGQSAPYVGGAGKNKMPLKLTDIKSLNTAGTWSGNTYSINSATVTVQTDSNDNVTGILGNGTTTDQTIFYLCGFGNGFDASKYNGDILNGCLNGGSSYYVRISDVTVNSITNNNGDAPITGLTNTGKFSAYINIASGVTLTNQMFYPMIRLATETDSTFAPYTNVCPISGHTEVDVQRDGRNWFDYSTCENKGIDDSGSTWNNSKRILSDFIAVKNNNYTVSFPSGIKFIAYANYNKQKEFVSRTLVEATEAYSFAPTTPYIKLYFSNVNTNIDISKDGVSTAQLELGSTATPYEPYQGNTYTIAIGDTIYGGTVDFDSGVMTVDRVCVDADTLVWQKHNTSINNVYITDESATIKPSPNETASEKDICSDYKTKAWDALFFNDGIGFAVSRTGRFAIANPSITTLSDFETAIEDMQICYELTTPFTVQLTPQQIQLLKGTNTLTASTGQISVTVNGVSGAIGTVQEQVNELAEEVAEIKPLNYSTTEQKTGQKWIDGKDIYFKVFTGLLATIEYNSWVNIAKYSDVDSLIDYTAYSYANHIISGVGIEVRYDSTSGYFQVQSEVNIANSRTITIFVAFYTKTT